MKSSKKSSFCLDFRHKQRSSYLRKLVWHQTGSRPGSRTLFWLVKLWNCGNRKANDDIVTVKFNMKTILIFLMIFTVS